MKECPYCKKHYSNNYTVCPDCGETLHNVPDALDNGIKRKKSSSKRLLLYILMAVIVCTVLSVYLGVIIGKTSVIDKDTEVQNTKTDKEDTDKSLPGGQIGDIGRNDLEYDAVRQSDSLRESGENGTIGSAAAMAYSGLSTDEATILSEADRLAAMYDYDGAIARVQAFAGYESNQNMLDAIDRYTQTKSTCIAYNVEEIPHFFYHSLLNDDRGFKAELVGDFVAKDNDCWMCSTEEFNVITQQMYDYGVVLISLHDLATETVDADGTKHFAPNQNLMLPPGKHPAVMSEDDLSYYHAYDNQGIASKLVLDESGKVKCEYINEAGETLVGDYDVVPLLSSFIDAHPDFSYHNAHCMIALTGYNGVFGYRTDEVYKTREESRLDDNQKVWLENHPDFDWDTDVAEATKIAEALKAEGYEFASHTWGHRNVQATGLESLMQDNERWMNWVAPIVGQTDSIIFAHGTDLAGPEDYSYSNEKFAYYKGAGYDYYANVDGSVPVWMQIRDNYVRDSRINIDGYRLEQAMLGNQNSIADMNALGIHDIESFFNASRIRPVEIMH